MKDFGFWIGDLGLMRGDALQRGLSGSGHGGRGRHGVDAFLWTAYCFALTPCRANYVAHYCFWRHNDPLPAVAPSAIAGWSCRGRTCVRWNRRNNFVAFCRVKFCRENTFLATEVPCSGGGVHASSLWATTCVGEYCREGSVVGRHNWGARDRMGAVSWGHS
jgi:hypothetical protein